VDDLPPFDDTGDLPVGVHQATLAVVLQRFGAGTSQRQHVAERLRRVYALATGTGHVARFVVFGSFVTAKPDPNDVDLFLLMDDRFDPASLSSEAAAVFDHSEAQHQFGATVFWMRRAAALDGEEVEVVHWQTKRDRTRRGIVEVVHAP
jgi:hypothetical protein